MNFMSPLPRPMVNGKPHSSDWPMFPLIYFTSRFDLWPATFVVNVTAGNQCLHDVKLWARSVEANLAMAMLMPDRLSDPAQHARNKAIFRTFCEVLTEHQIVRIPPQPIIRIIDILTSRNRWLRCLGTLQTGSLAQALSSIQGHRAWRCRLYQCLPPLSPTSSRLHTWSHIYRGPALTLYKIVSIRVFNSQTTTCSNMHPLINGQCPAVPTRREHTQRLLDPAHATNQSLSLRLLTVVHACHKPSSDLRFLPLITVTGIAPDNMTKVSTYMLSPTSLPCPELPVLILIPALLLYTCLRAIPLTNFMYNTCFLDDHSSLPIVHLCLSPIYCRS